MKKIMGAILLAWFAVIFFAALQGVFISHNDQPPIAVGVAFLVPLLVFLTLFVNVRAIRDRLVEIPASFLVSLHGWRFVGLGFIAAEMRGLLPSGFAWPAGLGDIAIAATAPYLVYRVTRDPSFRSSLILVIWNILGVVDFLQAVGLGIAHQIAPTVFHATVDTRLMQELPYALIPCFFVPLLGMTHLVLLEQTRRARRDRTRSAVQATPAAA